MLKCVIFIMILVVCFSIYKNREVARCFHGYRNYAPHSDKTRNQNLCTIPSSSRICIQIPLAYPALPNWHFQILPLYYNKQWEIVHGLFCKNGQMEMKVALGSCLRTLFALSLIIYMYIALWVCGPPTLSVDLLE